MKRLSAEKHMEDDDEKGTKLCAVRGYNSILKSQKWM